MNLLSKKAIAISLITLINMGVFAVPVTTNAAWSDILSGFGIGGSSQNGYSNQNSYDYNSTDSYNSGDIKMSKEVRQIGNSKYHDKITIRSGAAVEVWIEVKNTSSKYSADTIIRDEIGGSSVYTKNSLRVNGQTSQPGLTSTGLRINIPANGKVVITYQMNVCNSTNYPMRAYASAPSVGAATDAIIIYTETFNVGYYDNTYSCISQFQTGNTGSGSSTGSTVAGNPFGDWTGVNNLSTNTPTTTAAAPANNPFAGWTGVNNASTTTDSNPFAGWTGVNNANSTTASNSFGTWTGTQSTSANNPFGDWTGVQSGSANTEPFGTWTGVQSSNSGNPFGTWTGTQSTDSQYDMGGYSTANSANRAIAYETPTEVSQPQTYFVAPTTGVSESAPFVFAGILTAGFIAFRKRKLLFN